MEMHECCLEILLFYFSSDIWSSFTSHSYNTHKFQESVYKVDFGPLSCIIFSRKKHGNH